MPDWYTASGWPANEADGDSSSARAELVAIANAFAKLAGYTGAAERVIYNNSGGTGQTTSANFTFDGTTLSIPALSINGKTLATTANLTFAGVDGKALTLDNNLELAGTDGTKMTFPSTSATIARTDAANTFTGTQTINGDVLFADATYDIGKSGATRPRDGFFSRNVTMGGSATIVGNLLAGGFGGTANGVQSSAAEGSLVFTVITSNAGGQNVARFYGVTSEAGTNAAATTLRMSKDAVTSRSLNAAGSLNASGADYAEYERKARVTDVFAAGDLVGFNADGLLTNKWSEAVTFGVKSTSPSYVGGDSWGDEVALGCPEPKEPAAPQESATDAQKAAYNDAVAQYQSELTAFRAKVEAARQWVDRIAYAGKVPVNVQGGSPGQYIEAVESGGGIAGAPSAAAGPNTVGRVRRILADGRAEIAVIVC